MIKKVSVFLLMIIDIVIFIMVMLSVVLGNILDKIQIVYNAFHQPVPDKIRGFIIFLDGFSPVIKVAIMIITLLLLGALGNLYRDVKEKADFNEFGVRKKKAKRKLSSRMREFVEAQQLAETERIVNKSALDKSVHKGSMDPDGDLNKMIGLKEAKDTLTKLKARIDFEKFSKHHNATKEPIHMVFYGSPGTGKTTVARIVAGFLYDYGYIKHNKVFETDGNFLKGRTAADTERKIKIILDKAAGGVLFVDEAYALTQSHDAAGKQAIATLIKEMEDHPDKFVAIFAGYTNEMKQMLDTNPGFRSRIKEYVFFPDYDSGDLREIAISIAGQKGFCIDSEAISNFDMRIEKEKKLPSWGNGRTVRNVIEESINNHAYNYESGIIDKNDKYKLLDCDVSVNLPKRI